MQFDVGIKVIAVARLLVISVEERERRQVILERNGFFRQPFTPTP